MEIIKALDNTEIGMFIVVIFKEGGLRCPSLYMGKDKGIYYFIDIDNQYGLTPEYIKSGKVAIDNTLITDNEIVEIAKLTEKVKGGK